MVHSQRYLNPADYNPRRITKADKDFAEKLDFKDIKFLVKIRDIHKIGKDSFIGVSVFGYENKEKHSIYVQTAYSVQWGYLIYLSLKLYPKALLCRSRDKIG